MTENCRRTTNQGTSGGQTHERMDSVIRQGVDQGTEKTHSPQYFHLTLQLPTEIGRELDFVPSMRLGDVNCGTYLY